MKRIIARDLTVHFAMCIFAFTSLFGCGNQLQTLAVETMDNAKTALSAAKNAGAPQLATAPLQTAQEMLSGAETAMQANDTERAYRLALRAYLHARIATETVLAMQHEAQLQEAQKQLAQHQQRTAEALHKLTAIKAEYEKLKTLSEENE